MVFSLFPYLTFQNNTIPRGIGIYVLQESLLNVLSISGEVLPYLNKAWLPLNPDSSQNMSKIR